MKQVYLYLYMFASVEWKIDRKKLTSLRVDGFLLRKKLTSLRVDGFLLRKKLTSLRVDGFLLRKKLKCFSTIPPFDRFIPHTTTNNVCFP